MLRASGASSNHRILDRRDVSSDGARVTGSPGQAGDDTEDETQEPRQAMNDPAQPTDRVIDSRAFWRAIGNRATGSTVVTARAEAGPAGFLGLSATHLCADPPLMMVSIDRRTSALQTILAAR